MYRNNKWLSLTVVHKVTNKLNINRLCYTSTVDTFWIFTICYFLEECAVWLTVVFNFTISNVYRFL